MAVGLAVSLASLAVPTLLAGRDRYRANQAARHLATVIRDVRGRAIADGHQVALRFADDAASWAAYADGNRNGVRTADIERGIDLAIGSSSRLSEIAPGVQFGVLPGTVDIETGAPLGGGGVRTGAGNWLSFGPSGSSSSGTLYLRGPGSLQFAVRVFGATGRVRVFRFDARQRAWVLP